MRRFNCPQEGIPQFLLCQRYLFIVFRLSLHVEHSRDLSLRLFQGLIHLVKLDYNFLLDG